MIRDKVVFNISDSKFQGSCEGLTEAANIGSSQANGFVCHHTEEESMYGSVKDIEISCKVFSSTKLLSAKVVNIIPRSNHVQLWYNPSLESKMVLQN